MAKVKLQEIVDAIGFHMDGHGSWVDRETGEVLQVSYEMLEEAEEDPEEHEGLLEWERPLWADAVRIATSDQVVPLPDKDELDEWGMMRDFAGEVEKEKTRRRLEGALGGRGAYRRFKDAAHEEGVLEAWYAYRDGAFREKAKEWCEENGVEWE